ncbi:2-keto-4-pentenoate hydratase [Pararhodobacter oceanensis]|uniref:2-keto-4-pentenoate hydratase n=1 Tax=Pararhodobacter oceanensis TaxID=2172121 RepID=UPI003A8DBFCD
MTTVQDAAEKLAQAFAETRQIKPFSDDDTGFDLAKGYEVQRALTAKRVAGGAREIGVKVGFTNTQIWSRFGIRAPVHGPVFDNTLATDPADISRYMEPLIEPEIVLRLGAKPFASMEDAELLACVEAIAPGFELVHSIYPDWRITAADSVASGAMHGALALGEFVPLSADWAEALTRFKVALLCDGELRDEGQANNLLGSGPLAVLRHLLGLSTCPPLAAGDLISTGTLTQALPIAAGETWQARFDGLPLAPLTLRLA